MKMHSYRKLFLILFTIIIIIFILYLDHVNNLYANAMGEKNAIRIAQSIVDAHRQDGEIPSQFIQDIDSLLDDKRGVRYVITIKSNSSFNILYKPKSTWFFGCKSNIGEVLKISWDDSMKDIEVNSNIKRP